MEKIRIGTGNTTITIKDGPGFINENAGGDKTCQIIPCKIVSKHLVDPSSRMSTPNINLIHIRAVTANRRRLPVEITEYSTERCDVLFAGNIRGSTDVIAENRVAVPVTSYNYQVAVLNASSSTHVEVLSLDFYSVALSSALGLYG